MNKVGEFNIIRTIGFSSYVQVKQILFIIFRIHTHVIQLSSSALLFYPLLNN